MSLKYYIIIAFSFLLFTISCSDDDKDIKVVNVTLKNAKQQSNNTMLISLYDNETMELQPQVIPTNATNQAVEYETDSEDFIVSPEGVLTPTKPGDGKGNVTVKSVASGTKTTYPVVITDHQIAITGIRFGGNPTTLEKNQVYDFSKFVAITPLNAFDVTIRYSSSDEQVIKVDAITGSVTAISAGTAEITVIGSNVKATVEDKVIVEVINKITGPIDHDVDRSKWSITTLYPYTPDGSTGLPEHMFDGNNGTFMSIGKPSGGAANAAGQTEVYFTIDLKEALEVDCFRLRHRDAGRDQLKVWQMKVQGSDDGVSFKDIAVDVDIPTGRSTSDVDQPHIAIPKSKHQYYRFYLTDWKKGSGQNMQIAEFYLGYIVPDDN